MQETTVTQIWMAGVMAIMAAYGLIAIVGYMRRKK